jgi:uncharacterized membrane protein
MDTNFHPMPQPNDISLREKEDAMGAYLMMFAAMAAGLPFPALNLIAAVIYYFVNKKKGRFVHFHLLQSLYSQIPTTILNIGFVFWSIRILFFDYAVSDLYWGYIAMTGIANLIYVIFSMIAAVKARKGQFYYMLFFGKAAYVQVFAVKNNLSYGVTPANEPPRI